MQIIKQLRQKRGINQSNLALAIGVSLRTIQIYEKKDANIPIKNLTKIADYFGLSIADLYYKEIKEPGELYSKKNIFSNHGNVLCPLEKGKVLISAPLLMIGEQKKFLEKMGDMDFVKGLAHIDFLIDSVDDAFYMAFEILGDSMDDGTNSSISNGTLVLGRAQEVSQLSANRKSIGRPFVLIVKDRIICKSITAFFEHKETILCHNLNPSPEYKDFEIPIKEVLGLYEVVKKQV